MAPSRIVSFKGHANEVHGGSFILNPASCTGSVPVSKEEQILLGCHPGSDAVYKARACGMRNPPGDIMMTYPSPSSQVIHLFTRVRTAAIPAEKPIDNENPELLS